jgi:NAD(P)-dependent dehydrogenase (short-subunit alcohol dehydrogenase family)
MASYALAHANPQGPGDARPTALQIVQSENLDGKLKGKVIAITGTSSGIGIETARALSKTGATLFLTARDLKKAHDALVDILDSPGAHITLIEMDNASLESVRVAASSILTKSNHQVNILINNAGVMAIPTLQLTADGYEMQFAVNHLSHFLLFQLLKPALLSSTTPEMHSRVVNVSSSGHRLLPGPFNYTFKEGGYNPWVAYGQSKAANVYMANEIDRRYGSKGLHATSLHPGAIEKTALGKFMDPQQVAAFKNNEAMMKILKSPEQGAATTVVATVGREWENKGGKYLVDCAEATRGEDDGSVSGVGYVSHTYDPEREAQLWEDSLELVGLKDDI